MEKRGEDDEEQPKEASIFHVWEALKSIIENNIDFYQSDDSENGFKIHGALLGLIDHLDEAKVLYKEVESFCKLYDFDENLKGNGYRSFLQILNAAINHIFFTLKYVTENRSGLLFRKSAYTKEIEACNHLLAALIQIFQHLLTFHSESENGNLFPTNKEHSAEETLQRAMEVNQFAFYGRCMGFQYVESIKPILKFIAISMAGYSESYYSLNSNLIKATNSMYTSGKYLFDPELRARRIVNLSQNSSIDFCKSFWFLAENQLMHNIPFVNYSVKVNRLLEIRSEPLEVETTSGESFELESPGTIQVRLISSHRRDGMMGEERASLKGLLPKSKSLLIHAHGGGFVSQSSKSHLVYLLEWAVNLNVPILSVDYSLSPETPYPRALEEILYVYCWALKNGDLLGSTCETVILCGDSAGANLSLATVLKCIDMKIRKPDGIFLAYAPILVAFDPSPSRLLCLMDPLIPFGFLMRCLRAYSNGQRLENEDTAEGISHLQDLEEMKRAKADWNEELKRKCSLNPVDELTISDEERSDSFEEISCFERHHETDSDIKAHISQVSDGASNDTLAGTSFLTGTEFKNSCNNTIEIVSPIDSIQSATSLEEDSLPITIHKTNGDDQQATTSDDTTIKNTNKEYVDDFIEKYVLDAKKREDGCVKPVLRKVSKTHSEENIIFDVSKETLSVENIQSKVHRVATSLVDSVSSTFDQITRTNRPIINYTCENTIEDDLEVVESPSCDFLFTVPKDPFLSPYYATDDMLVQCPPIRILSLTLDTCLDDSIMFAKRLRDLQVDLTLDILDGLPHGFLNFSRLSKEAHEGSKLAMKRIAELLNINLDKDETKIKYFC